MVRQSAAKALGKIGDERAVKELTKTLYYDVNEQVRKAAKEALKRIEKKKK